MKWLTVNNTFTLRMNKCHNLTSKYLTRMKLAGSDKHFQSKDKGLALPVNIRLGIKLLAIIKTLGYSNAE